MLKVSAGASSPHNVHIHLTMHSFAEPFHEHVEGCTALLSTLSTSQAPVCALLLGQISQGSLFDPKQSLACSFPCQAGPKIFCAQHTLTILKCQDCTGKCLADPLLQACTALALSDNQLPVSSSKHVHRLTQDIASAEQKLATAHTDLQQSQQSLEQKQERMEEVEARSRELYNTSVRLEAHIADLESRKRAPLYQKKQEEELKAAIEKAQECEIRAVDAEIRYKEAKVCPENQNSSDCCMLKPSE